MRDLHDWLFERMTAVACLPKSSLAKAAASAEPMDELEMYSLGGWWSAIGQQRDARTNFVVFDDWVGRIGCSSARLLGRFRRAASITVFGVLRQATPSLQTFGPYVDDCPAATCRGRNDYGNRCLTRCLGVRAIPKSISPPGIIVNVEKTARKVDNATASGASS